MSILRNEVNKILKGIKEGDVSKQQELIESTCNFLKVISYKYLYNKDDVEDVVMEAYMKVYRSIDSCDLSLDGYNWICKIVENTAYDFNAEYAKNHKVEKALVVTEDFTDIEDAIADKDEVLRIIGPRVRVPEGAPKKRLNTWFLAGLYYFFIVFCFVFNYFPQFSPNQKPLFRLLGRAFLYKSPF